MLIFVVLLLGYLDTYFMVILSGPANVLHLAHLALNFQALHASVTARTSITFTYVPKILCKYGLVST